MFMFKVILTLSVCLILSINAVPIKTSKGLSEYFTVRPIEEIFQELDGYPQEDIVSFEFTQARDGIVKPIEEVFDELDNYQTTTEAFPDENTDEHTNEDFLRFKRHVSSSVRLMKDIFEITDNHNFSTEILSESYYTTRNTRSDEALMGKSERSGVKPIEVIFEELDRNQTTTESSIDENINFVIINQNRNKKIIITPIEEVLEDLDIYQIDTDTTESSLIENETNEFEIMRTEVLNSKQIEGIFPELNKYQIYTTAETGPEVIETVLQTKAGGRSSVVSPIEEIFENLDIYQDDTTTIDPFFDKTHQIDNELDELEELASEANETSGSNTNLLLNSIRPGMVVTSYAVEISPDVSTRTFSGRLTAQVNINDPTSIEDPIKFHVTDLTIVSVVFAIGGGTTFRPAEFFVQDDDGILEIQSETATLYTFIIEYEGQIHQNGYGLYYGLYDSNTYLAMNLSPTYARSVFPCMDEPTEESTISFTFSNIDYNNIVANSVIQGSQNNQFQFTAMLGPPHRWGMVAHNFVNINNLINGGRLFARTALTNQQPQTLAIINTVLSRMEAWTNRSYSELHVGQNEGIDIFAMPDITNDWNALSSVAIWEPYILIPQSHGNTQRKTAMIEISKAIASQWFGYVIYPENWRYQWINTGLATYSAFETIRAYQSEALETDSTAIDVNAVFVAEIIQESLLRDAYSNALPLEPENDLFDEDAIRDHVNGLMRYKAPAIMYMLKSVLDQGIANPGVDYVQAAAQALLNVRALQPHSSLNFYDAVNSDWIGTPNALIESVADFLEHWVLNSGYPVVHVQLRNTGVVLTQERFGFSNTSPFNYEVPISYTTSVNPNFNNTAPQSILDGNLVLDLFLGEDDWFLVNLQGQVYYRVNYDTEMWERIIAALSNPETRSIIHPLNRATLVDDALNLARAGRLDYDTALRVVLTMEHETDYSVWKAYIRNMDFIKKRLDSMSVEDFEYVYTRFVARTVVGVEEELGFSPDPLLIEGAMASITRGMVMEHACSANYQPCIAAAIDWFYDPNSNEPTVNPSIPHDIRPAVYCTMMREGDATARDALWDQFDAETSHYERLVIVKAFACSTDETFLLSILQETVLTGGRFGVEERAQFFKALIDSEFQNTDLALRFLRLNTNAIRNMYGGPERLEEIIYVMGQNVADEFLTGDFDIWVNSINSELDNSFEVAIRASAVAAENLLWNTAHLQNVYDWIDENDGNTFVVSFALLAVSLLVHLFN